MRLWGKVARGMLLVFAAICAVIAVVAPETRGEATLAVVIMVVVALVGVPALVRFFSSFTGDEEVLERGTLGTATVRSLTATGWRYNRQYPILRFTLDVEAAGVYPVEIKQAVDPHVLPRLAPGTIVAVRVDPSNRKKVVIDWRQPIRAAVEAAGGARATEGAPTPAEKRSARSRSSWLFLRWLFLVFGLIFLRLGCEAGYYEAGGARVQGVVLEKIYSPGTRATGAGRGSPSRYYVRYRFTTTEGRTLEDRADVLPGTWQKLNKGGPVEVEYLANSPDTNRIPGQRARAGVWAIMALALLGASVVLFILARRPSTRRVIDRT